jgi:hypothetical protein
MKSLNGRPQEIFRKLTKIDSLILKSIFIKMNSNELFELQWGHGMFSEGKQYIVETRNGFYKGTYKKPVMAIPYVILYNVTKDKTKMAQVIFYREDKFYDAEQYITQLKYNAQQARDSMEKRALNEILRQLIDENYV